MTYDNMSLGVIDTAHASSNSRRSFENQSPEASDTVDSSSLRISLRPSRSKKSSGDVTPEDIQLQILGVLTTGGGRTVADLTKTLGLKPRTVRYQLDQLLERHRIERAIMLNQRALGNHVFNVLFDLPRLSTVSALEFLEKRPEVSWLAENMGHRRFEVTFYAKDMMEASRLMHSMGESLGVHFRDPVFGLEVEHRHWGLRFLAERQVTRPVAHFVAPKEPIVPDDIDLKILQLLRLERNLSMSSLAKGVALPESTAKYRVDKLREGGAISDEIYFLRSDQDFVQAQLVLNLKSRSPKREQEVIDICSHNLHVEQLITGFGSWDFKVVLRAKTVNRLLETEELILRSLGKNVSKASMLVRNRVIAGREG